MFIKHEKTLGKVVLRKTLFQVQVPIISSITIENLAF